MRSLPLLGLLVVSLTAAPRPSHAWGFDGHRKLASMLHEPLPANHCLKNFLASKQSGAWQEVSLLPDKIKESNAQQVYGVAYDSNEWFRHYLRIDKVEDLERYPRLWPLAVEAFGDNASKNGQVPWYAESVYQQLVAAFAAQDETAILTQTFLLSHYVTDAFSVLHNTSNFDPNGLHSRWESDLFDSSTRTQAVAAEARNHYGTPGQTALRDNLFDIIVVGNGLVPGLIAADEAHPSGMTDFFAAVKPMTAKRWGDALTLTAAAVWTAWLEAGKPELAGAGSGCSWSSPPERTVLKGFPPSRPLKNLADFPKPVDPPQPGQADAGTPAEPPGTQEPGEPSGNGQPRSGCSQFPETAAWLSALWLAVRRRRTLR